MTGDENLTAQKQGERYDVFPRKKTSQNRYLNLWGPNEAMRENERGTMKERNVSPPLMRVFEPDYTKEI